MKLCFATTQVQIGAALFTGLLFGYFQLDKHDEFYLEFTVNSKFVELGNNLVLFFAGLSCDVRSFSQYYYAIGVVGR